MAVTPPAAATASAEKPTGHTFIDLLEAGFNVSSRPPMGLTENNSPTFLSSGDRCLDFFFHVVPDNSAETINCLLTAAWDQDPLTALKLVCHLCGVRGTGKSDRKGFYTSALWLYERHPETLARNAHLIAGFGSLKDLPEILHRLVAIPDTRETISPTKGERLAAEMAKVKIQAEEAKFQMLQKSGIKQERLAAEIQAEEEKFQRHQKPPSPPSPAERRPVDPHVWKACAASNSRIPAVGDLVYYFPDGHAEQASSPPDLSSIRLTATCALCRVAAVSLLADADTDETFAKIFLDPRPNKISAPPAPAPDGGAGAVFFAKVLTPGDANNCCGFSVPRYCADSILPPLDLAAERPVQNLTIRDAHGRPWVFRHIYRGTPRRHLLTTGWSKFVNSKKLIAGDPVVFIRNRSNELYLGIRRTYVTPMPGAFVRPDEKVGPSGGTGGGFSRGVRGRVPPATIVEAVKLVELGRTFEVLHYPRAGVADFLVDSAAVDAALSVPWHQGLRIRMVVEAEDSTRTTWLQGIVSEVAVRDAGLWPRSPWRMLQRLVKLELAGCEGSCDGISAIGRCCYMLEELIITDHRMEAGWLAALSFCGNLKTLKLQGCKRFDDDPGMDEYLGSCPTIEHMQLQRCQLRDKRSLRALFMVCEGTREIMFENCWGLDDDMLSMACNCRGLDFTNKINSLRSLMHLKEDGFQDLETMVKIKEAEARLFQRLADDARREEEGYRQIVRAKTKQLEEEYTSKLSKLCLQETEERRRQKLEELKFLENSHCDYQNMKMRMQAEIASLLERMEATKKQWV